MTVPNQFANVTTSIPLSQLDANFNTPITLGNTAIQLGNTVSTLNDMTLANVTVTSGNVTITNVSVTTANVTTANIATAVITTANVATANITTSQILNYGTANSVVYLNSSKAATADTGLQFDGSNLGLGVTPSAWGSGYTPIQGLGYSLYSGNTVQTRLSANEYFSSTASTYRVNGAAALYQQAGGVHSWHYAASGTAGNTISFTQAMTLDASGNLLVGATSGVVGAERISVDAGSNRGIVLKTSSSSNELVGCWSSATSGNNRFAIFWTETSATERGSIDYNRTGGLTRYNTTSDATLKNIIGDSDGQKSVEILNSTRIREYAWKDDEQQKLQIGVIAQELYETYKGAVSVGGEDAEGNYKPWGVDKTAFTFHLIAGWQAHEKMIQELKAEIAALKGNA